MEDRRQFEESFVSSLLGKNKQKIFLIFDVETKAKISPYTILLCFLSKQNPYILI